jgi:N-glycosylase/DNA lyase
MTLSQAVFPVQHYDLALTLASGQAFRWRRSGDTWTGVIGSRWVRLRQGPDGIRAEAAASEADADWPWLRHYLQTEVNLEPILASFPDDPPMRDSVAACRGLRLLRQEPWECLASFICSSTKQIVQIEQIVGLLCRRFGQTLPVPAGANVAWSFPTAERLAAASEAELRECKMGFRAPYVLGAARKLAEGEIDLSRLGEMPLEEARAALLGLPGVGVKIADCVLLFAYGFQEAFPVDVWIIKALQQLYFPKRRPKLPRLRRFSQTHFGPYGGYAQQYLFHYMRTARKKAPTPRQSAIDNAGLWITPKAKCDA